MSNIDKRATELLIENGVLVADTLRHLADNEIDSDYFAVCHTNENGTEIECELAITDYARQAAGTVDELVNALEAAEKRIAELEAREVKLPNPHAHLIWIQAGHAPDDYWDDVAVSHSEKDKCCDGSDRYPVYALWEIKEALSAIGINIAAAGKGE